MANIFGRLLYRESGFIFRESKTVGFFEDSNTNGNLPLRRFLNRDPVRCIRGLTFQIKGGCENSEENDHQDRERSLLGVYNSGYDSNRKQESKNSKLLRVAIIGEANSGKSTLTNCLTGHKICAVTAVPHTTRKQTLGVCMMGDSQIVLLDTPGVVTRGEARRLKMSRQHVLAPRQALEEADLIAVISDVSDKQRSMIIHESILKALERYVHLPSILILNKVDRIRPKMILLNIANALLQDRERDDFGNYKSTGGWGKFEQVFMISATSGDGVDDIKQYLSVKSKPNKWLYPSDTFTDQSFEEQMQEIFREKLLQLFEHEIPWQIRQVCEK